MPKITRKLTKNFTILPNEIITNKQMSSRARLTLITMLCLPDDWNYTEEGLMSVMGEGRSFVRNALNELESLKYLEREMIKENGRYTKTKYTIYQFPYEGEVREHRKKKKKEEESPSVKKSSDEIQSVEKPSDRKPSDGKSTDGESSDRIPSDRKSTDEKNTLQSTYLPSTNLPSKNEPSTDSQNTDSPSKDEVSTDIPSTDSTNPQSINIPEEEYKESKYEGKEEDSISINIDNPISEAQYRNLEKEISQNLKLVFRFRNIPEDYFSVCDANPEEELNEILKYFFRKYNSFSGEEKIFTISYEETMQVVKEYFVTEGILFEDSVFRFGDYKEMIDLYFTKHIKNDMEHNLSNFMNETFRKFLYEEIKEKRKEATGASYYTAPPYGNGDDAPLPFN